MDLMSKISVILPLYNVERFVRKCLESVISQTEQDLEIICVDDGSSDASASICEEYAKNDPRIKVFRRMHTNAGAVRNFGMDQASGEYVGFVDSDDWVDVNLFGRAYELAKSRQADVVEWGVRPYDDKSGCLGSSRSCPPNQQNDRNYIFAPLVWGPWGRLVRREFLLREHIRFQEVPYADDVYICCMIRALSKKTLMMPEALYYYRVNSGGSQQQSNHEHTHQIITAWRAVAVALREKGLMVELHVPFVRAALNSMLHSLNTITKSAAYVDFYGRLRDLFLNGEIFSSVEVSDLVNKEAIEAIAKIRELSDPIEFLVWQKGYLSGQKSKLWWDLQAIERRRPKSKGVRLGILTGNFFAGNQLKTLRGVVKQFLPYGYMRRHLKRIYHLDVPMRGETCVGRFLWDLAPFYFAQDREMMVQHAHGGVQPVGKAGSLSRLAMLARTRVQPEGNFENDFRQLVDDAVLIKRAAAYDRLPAWLRKVAMLSIGCEDGNRLARLSALLRYFNLKWTIELLGLPHDDEVYLRLIWIANHVPAKIEIKSGKDSSDEFSVTPASASPTVSFIVPAYNVERYVLHCLESLRRQTLRDIEIICIDDGSADETPVILDEVAARDRRLRVFHVENAGVAAARNLGLLQAVGRYVVFVDADDFVEPDLARLISEVCDREGLEVCFYDFDCFDNSTRASVRQYWTMANHRQDYVFNRVFAPRELLNWMHYGSSCTQMFSRRFLLDSGAKFKSLKLSEDALFLYGLFPKITRARCVDAVLYHYRKGDSGSAVSRLSGLAKSSMAIKAKLSGLGALEDLFENEFGGLEVSVRAALANRIRADVEYHSKASPAVATWIESGHCQELLRLAGWWKSLPRNAARLIKELDTARLGSVHDTYLVMGQVAAPNIDPIDSWLFFRWLQDHGVPSRYIVWKESSFYGKLVSENALSDVIVLSSNGRGIELFEHVELLARTKAVVCEWQFDGPVDEWLRSASDLQFVFLQHGVTGLWLTAEHRQTFARYFNWCNVFSDRERRLIEGDEPRTAHETKFFVAGLPRFDLLSRERPPCSDGERTVFVMFTWRRSLNIGRERLEMSAYWRGIKKLFEKDFVAMLRKCRIRLVVAPHHRLQRFIPNIDFGEDVMVVGQEKIAEWIKRADAMVTDFSSASFDFMYQHKPTIFWIPDKDDLMLDRNNGQDGGKVDSALSLQRNFYNTANTFDDVVRMLEMYAASDFILEPDKCRIADSYFENDGCISERVYRQVERICASGGQ